MKFKNSKGISLVTLSIAIIILVVITSVLVYSAQDSVKIKKLDALKNDISTLTDKVNSYYLENGDIPVSTKYENSTFVSNIKAVYQQNPNDGNDYYVLELSALDGVTLNYGTDYDSVSSSSDVASLDDLYVINKVSHTIYYVRSVEVNDVNYYTIQEDWSSIELQVIPIYTAEQLSKVGSGETITVEEAGGDEYTFSLDGTYVLKNDIDLSSICYEVDGTTTNDKNWTPIGTSDTPFTGKFYGNGYTISNLYINSTSNVQGLFGSVAGENTVICDLDVKGDIVANNCVAGIIGYQNQNAEAKICIQNCNNYCNVTGSGDVGGIVGIATKGNDIIVDNCSNNGTITSTDTTTVSGLIGGIVGLNQGNLAIINCYNTGQVQGGTRTGGILGMDMNTTKIINCYNSGKISGAQAVAGIEAYINTGNSTIVNCYNVGSITRTGDSGSVDGIIASVSGSVTIENCYYLSDSSYQGAGSKDSNAVSMTAQEMKASSFADTLNNNIANISLSNYEWADYKLLNWKYIAGDYPGFE